MKKKVMALVLSVMLMAALTACGGKGGNATISYDLPTGFTESSDMAGMYYGPDYPADTSNIFIQSIDDDPIGLEYTQDMLKDQLSTTYTAAGYNISNISFKEFTEDKLDDYDTLLIHFSYSLNGVDIEQIEYLIQIGKTTHVLTYTTTVGSDYIALFQESVDSVKIVK